MKSQFPEKVNARLNGLTSNDATEEGIFYVEFSHNICEEGQIREEFEKQLNKSNGKTKKGAKKSSVKAKHSY